MLHRWREIVGAALLLALAVACTGPAGTPEPEAEEAPGGPSRFPSPLDLDGVTEAPAPDALASDGTLDVETWDLVGPFPERVEVVAAPATSPWEALLVEEANKRVGLLTPTAAMHCVARQIGRFHLDMLADPGQSLRSFIASRCHASVPSFRFSSVYGEVPEATTEAMLLERWRESIVQHLHELTRGGSRTAGIWFGRDGERVVAVVAAGQRHVHVDPVSPIPGPDGRLSLAGEVLLPAANVTALVNRGRFGYAACTPDPETALPRFAFDCALDPADEVAVVSINYTPPGRLIGTAGINLLFWPAGRRTAGYRRPAYASKRTTANVADARAGFVKLLNEIRDEAGLAPLVEADEQSQIASRLAPHYFAAALGKTAETQADVIALGLIAGWNVDGILQSGHFTSAWVQQTNDVDRLLSAALEYPFGRSVLLAADVEQIAVGAIVEADSAHPALAAVIGTYALFSESRHAEQAQRVYAGFAAERSARGLRAPHRLAEIEPLCAEAAGHVQAGVAPSQALKQLLEDSVATLQRPMVGWIAEVSRLEDLEFPAEFIERPAVEIAVGVSHRKPVNEPWGRYVVLLVVADPPGYRI